MFSIRIRGGGWRRVSTVLGTRDDVAIAAGLGLVCLHPAGVVPGEVPGPVVAGRVVLTLNLIHKSYKYSTTVATTFCKILSVVVGNPFLSMDVVNEILDIVKTPPDTALLRRWRHSDHQRYHCPGSPHHDQNNLATNQTRLR